MATRLGGISFLQVVSSRWSPPRPRRRQDQITWLHFAHMFPSAYVASFPIAFTLLTNIRRTIHDLAASLQGEFEAAAFSRKRALQIQRATADFTTPTRRRTTCWSHTTVIVRWKPSANEVLTAPGR
ncbi:hypothetical protein K432DRAFT_186946 [Lepidopterella palustris CBS 459.81]|uniref:Uncharacterized protein n=1 Tax=Lepidopterella palustris CBS 459.81 TaxID=1314670 RepID=A0A8E2ELL2_9PEZI|nr:hypothetical protein K432DRAFT_186946 [Lepidopterella palustris CBS 459.81]